MKQLGILICMGLTLMLSSCGGVDSQIKEYETALKAENLETAANILNKLSDEDLTDEQKGEIKSIHKEYFSDAVNSYIDEFEKLMEEGEYEKAAEMMNGVDESMLTVKQASRIAEIMMKAGSDAVSNVGKMTEEAMGMTQQALDMFGGESN